MLVFSVILGRNWFIPMHRDQFRIGITSDLILILKILHMKNFTLIFLLLANFSLFAQNTYVPDDNFEQALIDLGYDSGDLDDYVPTANISGVTSLDVSSKNISDLTGIEDFVALTRLYCYDNQLTSLYVLANTDLTELRCSYNQLSSLDVSANRSLINLYCNNNQLTSFDVSANTNLKYFNCSDNQLTSLDVTANTALTALGCSSNQLTSLDVSANTALTLLNCSSNQLASIDVSANTALTLLNCSSNQLASIDVSANTALINLYCSSNQLTSLNVSANTPLTDLACYSNQLTSLDVSTNTALTRLYSYSNQLSSIDVSANTALTHLYCYSNQLTSLDVSVNTALTYLNCSSNQLTGLDVSANTALTSINCSSNQLTSLDVSANTALISLYCYSNQLTNLDVSANTDLTRLYCYSNQLTGLDVRNGNNANLTYFYAFYNPDLTCIYVDDNTVSYSQWYKDETATYVNNESECSTLLLTYVPDDNFEQALIDSGYDSGDLDDYVLTANISGVTTLSVNSKNISDLTGIEDFAALTKLYCGANQLTNLNVSANTDLTLLDCNTNQLTSLDVAANTALTQLVCYSNQLTNLDLRNGNNANLTYFNATDNPDLTCIYVDDNTVSYSGWSKDETATYVNDEAECTALATNGLKNVSEEKTTTAIGELEDAPEFSLFPNPVEEQFTIETNKKVESLKLYNLSGKLVKEFDLQDTYSVSGLPAGIYYLNISCENEIFTRKLVIE